MVIALAGNPNVGKSTLFNQLTGMKQHTGNWAGKTVSCAYGTCTFQEQTYTFVDLPGTYSLLANSSEEEIARDFICFEQPDLCVVVCDATCIERNLNLVLQVLEITNRVIVCVNLMDEAAKKNISINFSALSERLGVPVVGISARNKKGFHLLLQKISEMSRLPRSQSGFYSLPYDALSPAFERCVSILEEQLEDYLSLSVNFRWLALRLMEKSSRFLASFQAHYKIDLNGLTDIYSCLMDIDSILAAESITKTEIQDYIVSGLVSQCEEICNDIISFERNDYDKRDRTLDRIFTSKKTGIPVMVLLLLGIFWLTITGMNYPSSLLSDFFFYLEEKLMEGAVFFNFPTWLREAVIYGVYRVLAWVVSVMLPPMAIFFPLFTLLEDSGYLPRIAFNLDHHFKKACACGKQALTMCMGFGCNAAGVVGCRIIDSKRERLIAIITNNFVPCNGRFPGIIAIISMFFIYDPKLPLRSLLSALFLTGVILLGVCMTFLVSKILSKTVLKGMPSSFTLELPPYRKPQIGKVIVRSIFDRTLFVLGRAIIVAIPAGLVIWLAANIFIQGNSILSYLISFLNPLGHFMGMDGAILIAFILGFPANEIVLPLIIMAYLANGYLVEYENLTVVRQLFIDNGWTWLTALCTILFSLMHWPCSTTCLTIKKETSGLKWTLVSFFVPTVAGILICSLTANLVRLLQLL